MLVTAKQRRTEYGNQKTIQKSGSPYGEKRLMTNLMNPLEIEEIEILDAMEIADLLREIGWKADVFTAEEGGECGNV